MKIQVQKYNGIGNDFLIVMDEPHGTVAEHLFGPSAVLSSSSSPHLYRINSGLSDSECLAADPNVGVSQQSPHPWEKWAVLWCDRKLGLTKKGEKIGADGLIVVQKKESGNFYMRIINGDGSEPEMCGNGIRCMAAFLVENQHLKDTAFTIETPAGPIGVVCDRDQNGTVKSVRVDMGPPRINEPKTIDVGGTRQSGRFVSMGNPHFVMESKNLPELDLSKIGPVYEHNKAFPEGANIEFIEVNGPKEITMRVWERGAGETQACGTGACAVVVAMVSENKAERCCTVHLPGGDLEIEWTETTIIMTGPVEKEYDMECVV